MPTVLVIGKTVTDSQNPLGDLVNVQQQVVIQFLKLDVQFKEVVLFNSPYSS
jgi:hypothetical protein